MVLYMKVNILDKKIETLGLKDSINKILIDNNIVLINDLWIRNRKSLKKLNLSDKDIQNIIIKLQLVGLDLNKKKY